MPSTAPGHKIAAQRQNIVTIAGIPDAWATKAGAEVSADTSDVYDGGSLRPEKLAGPATIDNVTLSRPYRPTRDAAILRDLRRRVGAFRTTITIQPTDADLVPYGVPTVYPDALLVKLTEPEADAGSSDPGMVELEFAVEDVA